MLQQAGICTLPISEVADLPVSHIWLASDHSAGNWISVDWLHSLALQSGCDRLQKTALPADDYNYKYFTFQIVLAFMMYLIGGHLCHVSAHPAQVSAQGLAGRCCPVLSRGYAQACVSLNI